MADEGCDQSETIPKENTKADIVFTRVTKPGEKGALLGQLGEELVKFRREKRARKTLRTKLEDRLQKLCTINVLRMRMVILRCRRYGNSDVSIWPPITI